MGRSESGTMGLSRLKAKRHSASPTASAWDGGLATLNTRAQALNSQIELIAKHKRRQGQRSRQVCNAPVSKAEVKALNPDMCNSNFDQSSSFELSFMRVSTCRAIFLLTLRASPAAGHKVKLCAEAITFEFVFSNRRKHKSHIYAQPTRKDLCRCILLVPNGKNRRPESQTLSTPRPATQGALRACYRS